MWLGLVDYHLGFYQCDSGSSLNVDDHFVNTGPSGQKAKILTLRMMDATSNPFCTLLVWVIA